MWLIIPSDVGPTKTGISLPICAVWSVFLSRWRKFAFLAIQTVPSEDSDQTAQNCHSNRYGAFFIQKMLISILFLNKNICCGYSLEAPRWGASNEYPQHMFSLRNKKNIMWIPPLICSYELLADLNVCLACMSKGTYFDMVTHILFNSDEIVISYFGNSHQTRYM